MTNYNELRDGQEFYANGYKKGYEDAKKEFKPKLADWRLVPNTNGERYCTNCRTIVGFYSQKNYCPYCGAKMIAFETPNGLMLRTDETYYTY